MPIHSRPVETERLLLRVPEPADAGALAGVLWDPEVVERKQVTLHEPPGDLDLAVKNTNSMLRQWESRGYGFRRGMNFVTPWTGPTSPA